MDCNHRLSLGEAGLHAGQIALKPGVLGHEQILRRRLGTTGLRGETSLPEALAVGAAIEEIDILDLQERTTAATPADIAQVDQQLTQGSENHLRAFVGQWETQTGATYQTQYLDDEVYQTIFALSRHNPPRGP